jgi:hypothetical protein
LHETSAHQKISREVAHQRKFGRYNQIHVKSLRGPDARNDLRGVTFEVARDRIYLEKSYSQND